jgi:hypothetical protein
MRTAAPSASSRVLDKTLASFLEAVAARTSAPGGGTVAAVATAIAAALVEMAAQFSSKHWDDADAAAVRARELRERAAPLAQADAEAYEAVIAARGEPGYDEALSRAARTFAVTPSQPRSSPKRRRERPPTWSRSTWPRETAIGESTAHRSSRPRPAPLRGARSRRPPDSPFLTDGAAWKSPSG